MVGITERPRGAAFEDGGGGEGEVSGSSAMDWERELQMDLERD